MQRLPERDYMSVLDARTEEELKRRIVRVTHQLGFRTVTAMVVVDHVHRPTEFASIDNGPADYQELANDESLAQRDPVMQHCKHHSLPIVWNQSTYVTAGQADKWEMQAAYGYRHGIAVAMHMPKGRHFMLALDREEPLPADQNVITQAVAAVQLFAVYAEDAASRLLRSTERAPEHAALTTRELETLRWTMEGKTAWEIGRILGIAENTVIRHAANASRKLDCTSKHHAVVKALRYGLIW